MARESDLASLGRQSPAELLTEQFYSWERRGRGWRVWDRAVDIEPAFVPFRFHWAHGERTELDDGRQPTLLSRLADRIVGASNSRSNGGDLPVLDMDEAEPE